jgi:L-aminopeptidase/D-esterase-like protein
VTAEPFRVSPGVVAIPGVGVGLVTHKELATGLTVVLLPPGAFGAALTLGGAPATREVELLQPEDLVPGPDALLLTGGSAFGLAAADGVMAVLAEAGRGFAAGGRRVPIVPAAAIFDLGTGAPTAPDAADGAAATRAALKGDARVPEGAQGAGTGATVGKALGMERAMSGGQGAVSIQTRDGLTVAALAVVNAFGSVLDVDGRVLAGPRRADGSPLDTLALFVEAEPPLPSPRMATTLGVVIVNRRLDKASLRRVAIMAHDGLARAVSPAHTPWDGDTIFAIAIGEPAGDPGRAGALAAHAFATAIRRAVTHAQPGPV